MNQIPQPVPYIDLYLKKQNHSYYLDYGEEIFSLLDQPCLRVRLHHPAGSERIYPVYQQNAMIYGDYSEYMRQHGCACCSLTSMLAAMRPSKAACMPQDTIETVEKACLPRWDYEKNYAKSVSRQMPVTLYGISRILEKESIRCRYVMYFERKSALEVINRHLRSGNPVIFETSRIRYKKNRIVSLSDKKYAGSYHTMIMLGYDSSGKVIFTDSATRPWAGDRQRLKWADLSELMNYMFPQKNTESNPVYFQRRRNTGGFILVYSWEKAENPIQKNIDKRTFIPYN